MLDTIDHGPVRELRLARPPANALDPALITELTEALNVAASEASAVVISGREGMFSAGLDVPALLSLDEQEMAKFWHSFMDLLETVARSPIPVAAAITGHSPAGGAVISLFCDYRVMSEGRYKVGLNETRVGLMLPASIHQALVRLVGPHPAERLIVSGALMSPEQALSVGFIDQLAADPEATVNTAIAWCQEHIALPKIAMSTNRATMRESLTQLFEGDGIAAERQFLQVWFSEETQSTLKALVASLGKK